MNYIGKLESVFSLVRDEAVLHWGTAFALPALIGVFMIILAMRNDDKLEFYKRKARVFRYCHDCPYIDMTTEDCTISADVNEKCGLIDKTAGKSFTVTPS